MLLAMNAYSPSEFMFHTYYRVVTVVSARNIGRYPRSTTIQFLSARWFTHLPQRSRFTRNNHAITIIIICLRRYTRTG
jgi:hypothetical protein